MKIESKKALKLLLKCIYLDLKNIYKKNMAL